MYLSQTREEGTSSLRWKHDLGQETMAGRERIIAFSTPPPQPSTKRTGRSGGRGGGQIKQMIKRESCYGHFANKQTTPVGRNQMAHICTGQMWTPGGAAATPCLPAKFRTKKKMQATTRGGPVTQMAIWAFSVPNKRHRKKSNTRAPSLYSAGRTGRLRRVNKRCAFHPRQVCPVQSSVHQQQR